MFEFWLKISLKFVPKGPIDNIPALVQIMAWCCPGDKSLSEPMMGSLPAHIGVNRPQWSNVLNNHLAPIEHNAIIEINADMSEVSHHSI